MKRLVVIAILVLGGALVWAQEESTKLTNEQNAVLRDARSMGKHLIKDEIDPFLNYMYPEALKRLNKDDVRKLLVATIKGREEYGIKLVDITFGEPSKIVRSGNELQCTLSQSLESLHGDATVFDDSMIVGISSDEGKTWTFIDLATNGLEKLRRQYPNLSSELAVPEKYR